MQSCLLLLIWTLLHHNTQPVLIFSRVRIFHLERLEKVTWFHSFGSGHTVKLSLNACKDKEFSCYSFLDETWVSLAWSGGEWEKRCRTSALKERLCWKGSFQRFHSFHTKHLTCSCWHRHHSQISTNKISPGRNTINYTMCSKSFVNLLMNLYCFMISWNMKCM